MGIIIRKDGRKYYIKERMDSIFAPQEWLLFYHQLKGEKQKLTFNCLINTGARISEISNVKIKDINFEKEQILLRITKGRFSKKNSMVSNFCDRKPRKIPISSSFCGYLKKYIRIKKLSSEDFIGLLSIPAANIAMKKALIKAKIKNYRDFSIHNIRKTLENWLMGIGVQDMKLLKHFGHNKNTAIKYYLFQQPLSKIEKDKISSVIGNLYKGDGNIDILYDKIYALENKLKLWVS